MKILVISPVYSLAGVPLAQFRLAKSLGEIGHDVDLIYGCKKYRRTEKSKDSDQFNNDIIKKVLAKEKEMGKV